MKMALAVLGAFAAGVVTASLLQASPAVSQEHNSYEYRVSWGDGPQGVAGLNHLGSLGYRVVHMVGSGRDHMVFLLEKKKGGKERRY